MKSLTGYGQVDLRTVPSASWALLAFAALSVVIGLLQGPSAITSSIAAALPFIFAAGVIAAEPRDRRFVHGALAIVFAQLILLASFVRVGEWAGWWAAYAPAIVSVVDVLSYAHVPLLVAGVALVGLALGGIRTTTGWAIVVVGVLVAVAGLASYLAQTVPDLPLVDRGLSLLFGATLPIAWAFLVAAAVDARRRYLALGAGMVLLLSVVDLVLTWIPFGPGTDFGLLNLSFGLVRAVGWLALAYGAWRGEIDGAREVAHTVVARTPA